MDSGEASLCLAFALATVAVEHPVTHKDWADWDTGCRAKVVGYPSFLSSCSGEIMKSKFCPVAGEISPFGKLFGCILSLLSDSVEAGIRSS